MVICLYFQIVIPWILGGGGGGGGDSRFVIAQRWEFIEALNNMDVLWTEGNYISVQGLLYLVMGFNTNQLP